MALHRWRAVVQCLVGSIALALLTLVCFRLRLNLATATCLYLIVIVLLSLGGNFLSSAVVSLIAVGCLAYFFAPPAFSFRVSEQLTKAGSWAYKHPDVCEYCPRRCFAYSASIPQKGIGQATSFSLVHPEDRQRVEEAFTQHFKQGRVFDTKYRRPDQRIFVGVIAPVDPHTATPEEVRDRSFEPGKNWRWCQGDG